MKLIYVAFIFSLSVSAHAETVLEKMKEARHLVELMDYKSMFDEYSSHCKTSTKTSFDPATLFKDDPGVFQGVSPQSAYWPEVEAAYRRYQLRVCEYFPGDDFPEFFVRELASRISLDDLRASVAFYSSAAGRRFQQASVALNESFTTEAEARIQASTAKAYKETQSELGVIIEKYRKNPK